jgi:hypothetical protein
MADDIGSLTFGTQPPDIRFERVAALPMTLPTPRHEVGTLLGRTGMTDKCEMTELFEEAWSEENETPAPRAWTARCRRGARQLREKSSRNSQSST